MHNKTTNHGWKQKNCFSRWTIRVDIYYFVRWFTMHDSWPIMLLRLMAYLPSTIHVGKIRISIQLLQILHKILTSSGTEYFFFFEGEGVVVWISCFACIRVYKYSKTRSYLLYVIHIILPLNMSIVTPYTEKFLDTKICL